MSIKLPATVKKSLTTRKVLVRTWLIAALILVWVFVSQVTTSYYVPKFRNTLSSVAMLLSPEGLETHIFPTIVSLLIGFTLAVIIGVGVGITLARSNIIYELTSPIIAFLRSIPPPALLPIAIVLLGLGAQMRIGLITFGAVWPTLLATIDAVRNIDSGLKDMAQVYSIKAWRRFTQITLPAASPMILAGARTSLLYSITLIVLSEMVGASSGLGFSVLLAQRSFRIEDMWAAILLLGLLGLILNAVFTLIEATVLKWHHAKHSGGTQQWIN